MGLGPEGLTEEKQIYQLPCQIKQQALLYIVRRDNIWLIIVEYNAWLCSHE